MEIKAVDDDECVKRSGISTVIYIHRQLCVLEYTLA